MAIVDLKLEGDNAWPEIRDREIIDLSQGAIHFAVLPEGTESGQPSVSIRLDLPDGRIVFTQLTWNLLHATVKAIQAKYGTPGHAKAKGNG